MSKFLSVVIVVFSVLFTNCSFADFQEGVDAYNNNNYAVTLREFSILAKKGDARAQFGLGVMYDEGQGVSKDKVKAMQWYRKAAEQGFSAAQFNLGSMYRDGIGVAKNDVQAVQWYRMSAEQGFAVAQYNLGLMYRKGLGVAKDDVQAVQWFRKAADQGDASALSILRKIGGWEKLDSNDKLIYYVDLSTRRREGNRVKMWTLNDFKTIQNAQGALYWSVKTHYEFDCIKFESRGLLLSVHSEKMGEGEEMHNGPFEPEWGAVPPNSILETYLKIACLKDQPGKK